MLRYVLYTQFSSKNHCTILTSVASILVLYFFQRPNYDRWSKVCVVCTNGNYLVYYNAYVCGEHVAVPSPIISHADATVGYVNGKDPLNGYIDDVS
jgi:hypothetical protein